MLHEIDEICIFYKKYDLGSLKFSKNDHQKFLCVFLSFYFDVTVFWNRK